MKTLSLENINKHAPYGVRHRENNSYSFYFETDFGLKYTISFMLEHSFVLSGGYQFCINVEGAGRSPGDMKLRQTVFAIIEEFNLSPTPITPIVIINTFGVFFKTLGVIFNIFGLILLAEAYYL